MNENISSPDVLEQPLSVAWIVKNTRIWQMDFLDTKELAQFCYDRGLSDFRAQGIIHLWQLGLRKADLITSDKELTYDGLVLHNNHRYGNYLYTDERQPQQRSDGWSNAEKTISPLPDNIKLFFILFDIM